MTAPERRCTARAAAKINLALRVGRPRQDGFHPLATIYQAIGLYDDVTVRDADQWSVRTHADAGIDLSTVGDDESNIAIKAGKALAAHHGLSRAAAIDIQKAIPVAGGMAGGSADAAATLVALEELWGLDTSVEDLLRIAADLGSDVPFALYGGTALGAGRGELVTPIDAPANLWWLVVPHEIGLPTPSVFHHFDQLELGDEEPVIDEALTAALAAGDIAAIAATVSNELQPAAYDLRPDLAQRHRLLDELGADAVLLSGSGPTQLLLFGDVSAARAAAGELRDQGIDHVLVPAPVAGAHVLEH
ncbi:4-diphosphocytidyl-2-C-methyl-D-erythritol kinase [Nocardioides baekrokdamisoli]|uniref:4-diphosphocytidyl-2-C-methyl-D-erythritol kinase n=1 Tax=Nocardioides baekrokdamisoli TaxID=1804624 RepID=A0A3G9ILH9_9ACTN|nr:4-(cytidine 5'-diphospho)-2-C-methyl-D-erythritol kinase [Nocardioides baekrokdamisoli]BBH16885.1 4-diphosphocytidyl-2-C-methyl-D-erythritol kinase [Nocardioides baekrokdamisoli]